jgi:ADP-heptose:LPS heptosyltransferase
MRVGLAWSDNAADAPDRNRAMPLALLEPLLRRDDIIFHVIQRNVSETDRASMSEYPNLFDHSVGLGDFAQSAGLIALMDLVISVDAPVVHLAGALGVPAWVMLAHGAEWRWMRDRDDSPWYPSLRLFRQPQRGDWRSVLDHIGRNLDQWSVRRS